MQERLSDSEQRFKQKILDYGRMHPSAYERAYQAMMMQEREAVKEAMEEAKRFYDEMGS